MSEGFESQHPSSNEKIHHHESLTVLSRDSTHHQVLVLSVDFNLHHHSQTFELKRAQIEIGEDFPSCYSSRSFGRPNCEDPLIMVEGKAGQLRRRHVVRLVKLKGSEVFGAQLELGSLG